MVVMRYDLWKKPTSLRNVAETQHMMLSGNRCLENSRWELRSRSLLHRVYILYSGKPTEYYKHRSYLINYVLKYFFFYDDMIKGLNYACLEVRKKTIVSES